MSKECIKMLDRAYQDGGGFDYLTVYMFIYPYSS